MRRALAGGLLLAAVAGGVFLWSAREKAKAAGPRLHAPLTGAKPFSADRGRKLAPRFSPDGSLLAYALAEGTDARIVVQALDGSSRRFIGAPGFLSLSPVFFPDGRRIAYWKGAEGDCAIVEYDLEASVERTLVDCSFLPRVRFDLSPDGAAVVFTGAESPEGAAGLWRMDLAHRGMQRLTEPPAGDGDDLHPRFSNDGRRIAFFRGRNGARQAHVLDVDNGKLVAAGPRGAAALGLAWLGAGGLLMAGGVSGGLQVVDLASGAATSVGDPYARFPDVSARGDIAFERVAQAAASAPGPEPAASAAVAPTEPSIDLILARR